MTADAASPDTPTDPPVNTGIEETVRLTRAELMSGILVGIGGEHDTVPTQTQLDRAVDMIFRYAQRRDRQVAEAVVRVLDCLAAEPDAGYWAEEDEEEEAPAGLLSLSGDSTQEGSGSLCSGASGTPTETGEVPRP